jgi:esterase/lipase
MVTTISQTGTHALKLADDMCYCSKQIIIALNAGDMNQYSEWVDKQFELSKELREIESTRLNEAKTKHEVFMNQTEIDRTKRNKRYDEIDEMLKQIEGFVKRHTYQNCLSIVK